MAVSVDERLVASASRACGCRRLEPGVPSASVPVVVGGLALGLLGGLGLGEDPLELVLVVAQRGLGTPRR